MFAIANNRGTGSLLRWQNGIFALALGAAGPAVAASFATFNVTGATATVPLAINDGGSVAGYYVVQSGQYGFVRHPDGTIESFGRTGMTFNWPWSVNRHGAIVGYYIRGRRDHGFRREAGGTVLRINFPGARHTDATSINDSGVVTGDYVDANFVTHGFVRADRAHHDTMTSFDPAGSLATEPTAIDGRGDIAGWYLDASGVQQGFIRDSAGSITGFLVENAPTTVRGINDRGETAGYIGSEENESTGFIRTRNGRITLISPEDASTVHGINGDGAVTGYYLKNNVLHGFVRSATGVFTSFDPPHGSNTQPQAINDNGAVTGAYYDKDGTLRGFVRTP